MDVNLEIRWVVRGDKKQIIIYLQGRRKGTTLQLFGKEQFKENKMRKDGRSGK